MDTRAVSCAMPITLKEERRAMAADRKVARAGRALDVLAGVVFVVGVVLYARSWLGLRAMDEFVRAEGAATFAAIEHADGLARLGRVGIWLMAGAFLVGVAAALTAKLLANRSS